MSPADFDIVIVGGGLVGTALACALKDKLFKIAIIEKNPRTSIAELKHSGVRALALSPPSVQCLQMLSVWEKVLEHAEPIQEVQVSKKNHFGVTRIQAIDYQLSALGYVVNADRLNHSLMEVVGSASNITLFRPDSITEFKALETVNIVKLSEDSFSAKLCVAADGGASHLRKVLGVGQKMVQSNQMAIITTVMLEQAHHGIAYERFTKSGSIALLPMAGKTMKCIWIVPSEIFSEFDRLSDVDFLNRLQLNFGLRCGSFSSVGERGYVALTSSYAESLYSDRTVLIGNAANQLTPVAAQGFNLGLRDVATLAEHLVLANEKGQEIGGGAFLRNYANARQVDHHTIRQFTAHLATPSVLQWLGIVVAEWIVPFKTQVALRGLGWVNSLPKLCRGEKI